MPLTSTIHLIASFLVKHNSIIEQHNYKYIAALLKNSINIAKKLIENVFTSNREKWKSGYNDDVF